MTVSRSAQTFTWGQGQVVQSCVVKDVYYALYNSNATEDCHLLQVDISSAGATNQYGTSSKHNQPL